MKNTFLRMASVALTMWLGFTAGSANAVPVMFFGSANAGYSANIGNPAVSSSFADWYTFTIPAGSDGNGGSNVISLGATNVIFTLFQLYDSVSNTTWSGATGGTSSNLSFSGGAAPGNYTLSVSGNKMSPSLSGSYAGNISISPVPEPETYAMMLAGLGLLGFSARRRKSM